MKTILNKAIQGGVRSTSREKCTMRHFSRGDGRLRRGLSVSGCGLLILLSSSCVWMKSTSTRISEKRQKLGKEYISELKNVTSSDKGGNLSLTWNQATERMYLDNPSLIQADYRIVDAKQRQKQIWRDMVPGLSVGASDSFSVGDIGNAFSDTSLRINSFLTLGNLLDLPKRVYTRKLYYIGARIQAENIMRQQVIALYRFFQQQRLLQIEKRAIDFEGQLVSGITDIGGGELLAMRLSHKEALEAWRKREKQWRTNVGDFFMGQYGSVNLVASGLPDVIYRPNDLDFSDTSRWGLLQLNLVALEEIAEDGQALESYLRYLPQVNMAVSAPPLYSSTSNSSFDAEAIRLGPSMNWNMDSRGYIGQQIDRLKRNKVIQDWRKDKRRRQEIIKLLEGKEALRDIQQEQGKLNAAIEGYKMAVKSGLVEDPQKAVTTMRKLRERQVRLKAKEIEISTEFWLIDEKRWKPITRRWLQTREQRTKQRKKAQSSGSNPLFFWSKKKS
ncbi:MAG: hypothetical protein AB8F34_07950 [Akkermansiaceae bacterium]